MGSLDGRRHEDVFVIDLTTGARKLAVPHLRYFSGASPDGSKLLYYEDGDYHVYSLATGQGKQHHAGAGGVVRGHRRRPQQRQAADQRGRLGERQQDGPADRRVGHLEGAGRGRRRVNLTVNGKKDAIRYQQRFALEPPEDRDNGIDLSKPQYSAPTANGPRRRASRASSPGKPGVKMLGVGGRVVSAV